MVYDAIALALYMGSSRRAVLRCLLEGLRWLWGAAAVKVAGKSGISQARRRLGEAPRHRLYAGLAQPIATRASKGAWYRDGRLVSLDGSCLEVADTAANRTEFGGPGASRGARACPQLRLRRWWRTARTCCSVPVWGPMARVRRRWPMRCWRRCVPACCAWPTGSSSATRSGGWHWEIDGALAELKTRLRGARVVLRSKTPELVRHEFWGLLLAHFAVRGLMHEAALKADEDPDRLSFSHAVRIVRRKLPLFAALSPSGTARPASGGAGRDPGGARG
jgi:hypothetical protein